MEAACNGCSTPCSVSTGLRALSVLLLLLALLFPEDLPAQSPTDELEFLRDEVTALKEGQATIRKDLQEIKSLLRAMRGAGPAPPSNPVLSVDGEPFKGSATAPITVIEFSDYQCPFCARHVQQTLPEIERDYIKVGKVKYVFRDFPITGIHKDALKAAKAANCAGEQEKYWEMHDRLFANRNALAEENLKEHASAIGLKMEDFQACLSSDRMSEEIREDLEEGQQAGVRGTPTFFIGRTDPDSPQMKTLLIVRGAQPYASFQKVFESLLTTP